LISHWHSLKAYCLKKKCASVSLALADLERQDSSLFIKEVWIVMIWRLWWWSAPASLLPRDFSEHWWCHSALLSYLQWLQHVHRLSCVNCSSCSNWWLYFVLWHHCCNWYAYMPPGPTTVTIQFSNKISVQWLNYGIFHLGWPSRAISQNKYLVRLLLCSTATVIHYVHT